MAEPAVEDDEDKQFVVKDELDAHTRAEKHKGKLRRAGSQQYEDADGGGGDEEAVAATSNLARCWSA